MAEPDISTLIHDPETLTPAAREVYDRYSVMIDQGKVCPLCGASLVITWPCVGGEYDGELFIRIKCSRNDPDTGQTCEWDYEPNDEELIELIGSDYEIGRACQLHGGCCYEDCCEDGPHIVQARHIRTSIETDPS